MAKPKRPTGKITFNYGANRKSSSRPKRPAKPSGKRTWKGREYGS